MSLAKVVNEFAPKDDKRKANFDIKFVIECKVCNYEPQQIHYARCGGKCKGVQKNMEPINLKP